MFQSARRGFDGQNRHQRLVALQGGRIPDSKHEVLDAGGLFVGRPFGLEGNRWLSQTIVRQPRCPRLEHRCGCGSWRWEFGPH